VTQPRPAAATLPPPGLTGLDRSWSRLVEVADADGIRRGWHVLDRPAASDAEPLGTLLCVHGNPTWSYLWRHVVAQAPPGWRVVAPDHLDMGFSERTGTHRGLPRRIDDLGRLTEALDIAGPVVIAAHDWGGPISLGWALQHREQLAGIALTNTAVHQPEDSAVPGLIRLARSRAVLPVATVRTQLFLRGTLDLSRPRPPAGVRAGYLAPYSGAERRLAIGGFVQDIPLDEVHPSWDALVAVRDGLAVLGDVPTLLLWGPADPVFGDRYLADLRARLPHAAVHRFEGASHLLHEDADVAGALVAWLADPVHGRDRARDGVAGQDAAGTAAEPAEAARAADAGGPLWAGLEEPADSAATAVVQMTDDPATPAQTLTWAELRERVEALAAGLAAVGVQPGQRVVLMVPPGIDLTAVVYACWRAGAVIVLADAGLGVRGLHRAVRGARPDHLIGIPKALAAARALSWPGQRIAAEPLSTRARRALGVRHTLDELAELGPAAPLPAPPGPDDDAAVLFTSGSTGPAKGVVYRHRQLQAQREAVRATYAITPQDRLVAAFAPFALFGPALGITSVVPAMDVTAPRTLSAAALADAASAVDATLVFSSPAALENVLATSAALDEQQQRGLARVRLLLSAGAPVPAALLRRSLVLLPAAEAHTPYGMTEVLPVADIALAEIEKAGLGPGVCVGRPIPGVEVALRGLDAGGRPRGALVTETGLTGEVSVRAAHLKDRYDRLWLTEASSSADPGWHRSGDVGQLDTDGRLWIEGRLAHVVVTAGGPVTPVAIEQAAEGVAGVTRACTVGVGPRGTQQVVVVVEPLERPRRLGLAPAALASAVRDAVAAAPAVLHGQSVAAVLVTPQLPVDVRHNSKIDRTAVAADAAALLAGRVG
jgi:olefin beta-lactone synthetase